MKNGFIAAILLIALAITISSCFSSRKYGCPGTPQATSKFRV